MELDLAIAVSRFMHEAALLFLVGGSLYSFYAPRVPGKICLGRSTISFLAWLSLISAFSWLAAYLAYVSDDLRSLLSASNWLGFLIETELGRIWSARICALIALVVAAAARARMHAQVRSTLIVVLSGALLVGLAWMGHAASGQGPMRAIGLANHGLHVVAVATWLGGLAPLLQFLRRCKASQDFSAVPPLLEAFSRMGVAAVSIIAATGVLNTYLRSEDLGSLPATTYGRLLALKIVLFIVLVCIAACNRWVFLRQLRQGKPAPARIAALCHSVGLELILGVIVVAVAVMLAMSSPSDR